MERGPSCHGSAASCGPPGLDQLPQLINYPAWRDEPGGPATGAAVRKSPTSRPTCVSVSSLLPGITGLWQVEARTTRVSRRTAGVRSLLRGDRSIVLDLVIMLGTVEQLVTSRSCCCSCVGKPKQDEGRPPRRWPRVASVVAPQPQVAHRSSTAALAGPGVCVSGNGSRVRAPGGGVDRPVWCSPLSSCTGCTPTPSWRRVATLL